MAVICSRRSMTEKRQMTSWKRQKSGKFFTKLFKALLIFTATRSCTETSRTPISFWLNRAKRNLVIWMSLKSQNRSKWGLKPVLLTTPRQRSGKTNPMIRAQTFGPSEQFFTRWQPWVRHLLPRTWRGFFRELWRASTQRSQANIQVICRRWLRNFCKLIPRRDPQLRLFWTSLSSWQSTMKIEPKLTPRLASSAPSKCLVT